MSVYRFPAAVRRLMHEVGGNIATLFALSSPIVLLTLAYVVDYGNAVSTKQRMQAAMDAAVLAGARAGSTTTAANFFAANGGQNWSGATTSFTLNGNLLSGSATYTIPTLFTAYSGPAALTVNVAATAQSITTTTTTTTTTPVCVLLTNPSASQSLLVNSGAKVSAPTCEIDVASTGSPAAMFNSGSTISALKTCVKGNTITNNGGTVSNLAVGCATVSNPFVGQLPLPPTTTCSGTYANGGNFSGTTTLSPGVYCGWFNFNSPSNVTFLPGVYVIKNGGWNVNGGTFNGSGVSFYFADTSKIQFNSGMNLSLSAPTSGTYSGILFYEPDGLSQSQFVFDDSVSETMSGLIYLPSRQITFNSTSNETTPSVTVVANTAIFNSLNWSLSPSSQWSLGRTTTTTTTTASGGTPVLTQ